MYYTNPNHDDLLGLFDARQQLALQILRTTSQRERATITTYGSYSWHELDDALESLDALNEKEAARAAFHHYLAVRHGYTANRRNTP